MTSATVNLEELPQLAEIFRLLTNGRHLNRAAEPALWAELEQEQDSYELLFQALGYEMRVDARGFAWFHTGQGSATTSNTTRQLALLFMVLFDYQADHGKALQQFTDWRLDKALLEEVAGRHEEVLSAEELDADGLYALLGTAERFGFARQEHGGWYLLPAVARYLDYFEELASHQQDDARDWLGDTASEEGRPSVEDTEDEEGDHGQ